MIRTVLALDLSKTSTGYAIGQCDSREGTGRIVRFGTITPHPAANGARWLYPVVEALVARLERQVGGEAWFPSRTFSVAVEASIYGESFSEFQFYLTQEALRWAAGLGVDVCTYAPGTLKAWVRRWSARELPKKLEKYDIERVWRTELAPRCPEAVPSSVHETDDAVDAGWLALLALYAQAHVLPVGRFAPGQEALALWDDPDMLRRAFLKAKLNHLRNLETPEAGLPPRPDLSGFYGNLRDNKHLSVLGKGFYPFRQLDALAAFLRVEARRDPEAAFKALLQRKRPDISARSLREVLEGGRFSCALDSKGRLVLVPEAGHGASPRQGDPPPASMLPGAAAASPCG